MYDLSGDVAQPLPVVRSYDDYVRALPCEPTSDNRHQPSRKMEWSPRIGNNEDVHVAVVVGAVLRPGTEEYDSLWLRDLDDLVERILESASEAFGQPKGGVRHGHHSSAEIADTASRANCPLPPALSFAFD